jgi:thioredoxin 1
MSELARHITDQEFEAKVLERQRPVLVDFWAPWCGPCQTIGPFLEKLAAEFQGEVDIVKVNVDENAQYSGAFGVRSIPTLILFASGEIVARLSGLPEPQSLVDLLEDAVERYGSSSANPTSAD